MYVCMYVCMQTYTYIHLHDNIVYIIINSSNYMRITCYTMIHHTMDIIVSN